jgi:hypothetical protein
MEKKKQFSLAGKQLSRKQMKNLTGGAAAGGLVYFCEDYICFFTKGQCQAHCGTSVCRSCSYCP